MGSLETRLACDNQEIRQAQALRYQVFYQELSARPGFREWLTRRDSDRWDAICDHLLVFDHEIGTPNIVATYRLLRQTEAIRHGIGFYSQTEFDIEPCLARHPDLEFMELGRSCVLPKWRTKRTIELLWHGSWAYVRHHGVDVMLGCASFVGTDLKHHAESLSFLYHYAAPDNEWDIRARSGRSASYDRVEKERIDPRKALSGLPPLIKGYLRLGAWIGRDAVIDPHFRSIDVLVILPVHRLNPRYVKYYGADAQRHAVGPGA